MTTADHPPHRPAPAASRPALALAAALALPLALVACSTGQDPTPQPPAPPPPTAPAAADTPAEPDIGRAVYVGDAVIRNYDPKPQLVTPVTPVDRPAVPAVDIHCHWGFEQTPQDLLAAMDELGLTRAINLSGGHGEKLDRMLATYHAAAPGRLVIFTSLDYSGIDDPQWGQRQADALRAAHARGAAGLKVWKDLGLTLRDATGELVRVDDRRLDPIWQTCGELGMPVLIHTADPAAFFEPIDEHNERWMQLKRRPSWSFYGPQFPPRDEVLAQRDRVIQRHPGTTFIGAHMGENAEDLVALARRLQAMPNFHVDISGRVAELGRQPYSARAFILQFHDRVLFGTDRYPGRDDQPRHRIYYRFLETRDEYFKYYDHPFPPTGEWMIYGIHLPPDVLASVYRDNAERLLNLPPLDAAGATP